MKTSKYLADRLREVLTNGKWVTGTNCKQQILNTDWKEAVQSIDGLNSIAKLTFHLDYYMAGVAKVLQGGALDISDKFSFDLPAVESQKDWKNLTEKFCKDAEQLIVLVEAMKEEKLFETFVDEKYGSYKRNIDVIIEHSYYHLGQILLIKKLLNKK